MLRALTTMLVLASVTTGLWAIPFYWESKTEEPGFTIDVPSLWGQASRSRDKVANVHFEKKDRAGRVAIEVRAYSAENTDLDQLILQLRTRLAVKYDRVFLVKRKEVGFRKNLEKQIWTVRSGKKVYSVTTAFVVADDKVLQLICVAPANRTKEYQYVFDNALLSLDFSDGKPDSEGGSSNEPAAAEAAPASAAPGITVTAPTVTGTPATGVTVKPPTATVPAAPAAPAAAKPKPPKIDF
ncbi:MAG: hypothetical protein JNJ69_14680 [Leptospiraceae bacterium]|nr:hypothetical protein [Leptospiraceae bacterium]